VAAPGLDQIGSRGVRFVGMTVSNAAAAMLSESGRPMHAKEILKELEAGGVVIRSRTPINTLVSALSRAKDRFERTGPNTFRLVETDRSQD
jgi:hypothetical protein